MKIIVTGSKGVIGQEITTALSTAGNEILELDLKLGHNLKDDKFVKNYFRENSADALINCFALNDHVGAQRVAHSFLETPLDSFRAIFEVNVVVLFEVCRSYIRSNKQGIIINFSSIYGLRSPRPSFYGGMDKHPAYGASKAAVSNLTQYLAVHAPNFRINSIVPGGVENSQSSEFIAKYCEDLPKKRLMDRSEIVGITKFLLSEDASYCTGSDFLVDGGWNAR